jgi:dihydroflavonol-4-reductase
VAGDRARALPLCVAIVRAYVTGASGFIGGHVVRTLADRGAEVRDEWVDVLDERRLKTAIGGCEAVFHLAALYSYDADAQLMERINVQGTRNVIEACIRAGVRRLVHCSTCGTCGPVPGREATEEDEPPASELAVPYKRTKVESEALVREAASRGELDAVVVNPTTPVGDGDRKPTPTGQMVWDVALGRMPGYVATTGLNIVDVRDVADGHALAYERGTCGDRYLLGGVNLSLGELFDAIADLAGVSRPRVRVPYTVALAASKVGLANRNEVRLARFPMYFSSHKAETMLGYRPGPVTPALARAVREALQIRRKGGV